MVKTSLLRAFKGCLAVAAACAGLSVFESHAQAQETEPYEIVVLPDNINILLGYYLYRDGGKYYNTSGNSTSDSGTTLNLGLLRYVHSDYIYGMPAGFQIYQGVASATNTHIGGAKLNNSSGAINTTLSAFIWPYVNNEQQSALILAAFLDIPDGQYNKAYNPAGVNVGSPEFVGEMQVGWHQGFGEHFSIEDELSARFFGDSTSTTLTPYGRFAGKNSTTPVIREQLWLQYSWNKQFATSIGYEGFFGGIQTYDLPGLGVSTKVGTQNEQLLRAAVQYWFLPNVNGTLEINHDVSASGGFIRDFGLTARLAVFF